MENKMHYDLEKCKSEQLYLQYREYVIFKYNLFYNSNVLIPEVDSFENWRQRQHWIQQKQP